MEIHLLDLVPRHAIARSKVEDDVWRRCETGCAAIIEKSINDSQAKACHGTKEGVKNRKAIMR